MTHGRGSAKLAVGRRIRANGDAFGLRVVADVPIGEWDGVGVETDAHLGEFPRPRRHRLSYAGAGEVGRPRRSFERRRDQRSRPTARS
jgi:hypothetical protein